LVGVGWSCVLLGDEVKLNLDVQMMELVGETEPQTEIAE